MKKLTFSKAAQECIDETGTDPMDDVDRIRAGKITATQLIAECLNGADEDRRAGWYEYVDAVLAYCTRAH